MAKQGKRRRVDQGGKQKKKKRVVGDSAADGERDRFFQERRDEELHSSDDEEAEEDRREAVADDEGEEEDVETAEEKRLRVARAYLTKIRDSTKDAEDDDYEGDDSAEKGDEERRGARDTIVADLLQQQQLEESGRVQRKLAARVVEPLTAPVGKNVSRKHRQSVTVITLTEDDSRGFSASKDGLVVHWDIETGQSEKYDWPSVEASNSGSVAGKSLQAKAKKLGSRHLLAMAVSSDGRYLAAGGLDRSIHLWDTRTRKHLQAFPGHKGAISSLVFRQGTQQLMSGSFDRTIKLWSVDDRSYIDTLYGHQSEVLSIDCLRQERVLSAGRDRTLRLWKVPEETQLVFRGHAASMDSCCFLSNSEFFSGSDDGSVALWNTLRKKPVSVIKSAHGTPDLATKVEQSSDAEKPVESKATKRMSNGHCNGNGTLEQDSSLEFNTISAAPGGAASAWIGAVASCRGSDLVASGAGDGMVRLWALEEGSKGLRASISLPVKGFVNSLAFAHSGRFLLAGTGQEPRLGRWGRIPHARNGVVQHTINLSQ